MEITDETCEWIAGGLIFNLFGNICRNWIFEEIIGGIFQETPGEVFWDFFRWIAGKNSEKNLKEFLWNSSSNVITNIVQIVIFMRMKRKNEDRLRAISWRNTHKRN